jgi:hypothetical protein
VIKSMEESSAGADNLMLTESEAIGWVRAKIVK